MNSPRFKTIDRGRFPISAARTGHYKAPVSDSPWRAGFARRDISPTEPIWLAGWGDRTEPSDVVSQPIHAKAMAMSSDYGPAAVIVTTDLLALSREMTEAVATAARQQYNLKRSQLILASSHSHSAPVTTNVLPYYYNLTNAQWEVIHRYSQHVERQMIAVIGEALNAMTPATLTFGQGSAGFAVNRRRTRPGCRHLPGPVDHDVPVLTVRALDGVLRGVMFGYACHTTAINDGTVNGDYAGYAQAILETEYPGTTALFLAGCGGDANPLPRHTPGIGQCYGEILATAVNEVLAGGGTAVAGPLATAYAEVDLPFEPTPCREEILAKLDIRGAKQLLGKIDAGVILPDYYSYPIQVWRFGSQHTLIALTSEVVVDYALQFKAAYGWESTWPMAYTNEHVAYIPSRRVRQEGGYEGADGMWECGHRAPFTPNVESRVVRQVDKLVQETVTLLSTETLDGGESAKKAAVKPLR